MIVKSATEPGDPNIPNEDWVYASEDLLIVIDGATARTETGCVHGVAWYAEQLGQALTTTASAISISLQGALAEAISHVTSLHPECDLTHLATPSAAVGVVRFVDDVAEILVLADVTIAVVRTDETVKTITDTRVARSANKERSAALTLPIGHPDRDAALRNMKVAQQDNRNQPGGFFVAAVDPSVACQAITVRIPADEVTAIAVLSDGAARSVDAFQSMSWDEMKDQIRDFGPKALINSVRAVEMSDPDAERWPRSKTSDDASIAYVSLRD